MIWVIIYIKNLWKYWDCNYLTVTQMLMTLLMICFHFCCFPCHNHATWGCKKGVNNQKREMSACPPIPLKKPYFMPFSSQPKYLLRSPSKAFPCLVSSLQVPILTFKKGIHLEKVPALSQTIVTERLILCDITSFHFTMDIEKEVPKYLLIIKLCNLCIIDYWNLLHELFGCIY